MEAPDTLAIDVRPTSGYTGAEIFGVDLSKPLDPVTVGAIRAALLQWKVLFFRDQEITPALHVEFGRQFGKVTPAHPTMTGLDEQPEILVVSDRKNQRATPDGNSQPPRSEHDSNDFHCDMTFVPNPPWASILRAIVTPPYGGDTTFSNLVIAYETLSKEIRDLLDRLQAVHENTLPAGVRDLTDKDVSARFESTPYTSVHPVVRVHPETGEKAVYVNANFTRAIVDLSRSESEMLLTFLFRHISNPAFTTRFRWQPNSIAFWDNRSVAHLAPGDLGHLDFDRVMHRITLAGDIPIGPNGFRGKVLSGQEFH